MYAVFRVDAEGKGKVDEILKDDLVSRQSISVQDAKSLELKIEGILVLVEGAEEAIARAEDLFEGVGEKLGPPDAEAAHAAFKRQEEDVAAGVGTIFG
jgi:hypothetical protein